MDVIIKFSFFIHNFVFSTSVEDNNCCAAAKAAARASRRWSSSPMFCFQKVKGMPLRKVGDAAGYEGRGLGLRILRSLSWGWVDDAIRPV